MDERRLQTDEEILEVLSDLDSEVEDNIEFKF